MPKTVDSVFGVAVALRFKPPGPAEIWLFCLASACTVDVSRALASAPAPATTPAAPAYASESNAPLLEAVTSTELKPETFAELAMDAWVVEDLPVR
ncbi:MAG: hypothetical protein AAFO75_03645, partial [Pseudomonadota bacterium]